ncbi:hypothetical protein [Noviherbaspirillum agri]
MPLSANRTAFSLPLVVAGDAPDAADFAQIEICSKAVAHAAADCFRAYRHGVHDQLFHLGNGSFIDQRTNHDIQFKAVAYLHCGVCGSSASANSVRPLQRNALQHQREDILLLRMAA